MSLTRVDISANMLKYKSSFKLVGLLLAIAVIGVLVFTVTSNTI